MSRVRVLAVPLVCSLLAGCPDSKPPAPVGAVADLVSPKDSPLPYKVLEDKTDTAQNSVEYHVLVATQPKHDQVDALTKYLYGYLVRRHEDAPVGVAAYVYSNEVQYKTPPRSPIGSVVKKPNELAPTFDNKVPLEFSQQIDVALEPHSDKGWKLERKVERDDADRSLTITVPFTENAKDEYAKTLSFNQAINTFCDTTTALFDKVPELKAMTFIGKLNDKDVVKISLDRPTYQAIDLHGTEESIGQLHGRAFLELATGHSNDAKEAKAHTQRVQAIYKKMLAKLKPAPFIDPSLK